MNAANICIVKLPFLIALATVYIKGPLQASGEITYSNHDRSKNVAESPVTNDKT